MLKDEILTLLYESESYVSGQDICNKYNISRTTVWKAVKSLRAERYDIRAVTNKGYILNKDDVDILNQYEIDAEFKKLGIDLDVLFLENIGSTNTYARDIAEKNINKEFLVLADNQTDGKGRRGRQWKSYTGANIAMSILIRPEFMPNKASMLTLLAAVSVADVLNEKGINCKIKWPNDIVVSGKKICGILTEMSADLDGIRFVICGIGINANIREFDNELKDIATSISIETGKSVIRKTIVAKVMKSFLAYYNIFKKEQNLAFIKDKYESLLASLNKEVVVHGTKEEYEALCSGINENGELIVKKVDNSLENIGSGEVSIRGINGYI